MPALDHFSIAPATLNASTCLPNAITIIAENAGNNPLANYTNQIDITVSTSHGNWSINNADGALSPDPDSNDDGAVSYTFVDTDASEIVLNFSNTHAENVTITVSDTASGVTSTSVPITFSRNVLVITEDPIQIAGRPQAMVVEMWTDDLAGSASCGIDTNYNSITQSLQASIDRGGVLLGALDPTINGTAISAVPAGITLDFSINPGSAVFDLDSTDVGQYSLLLQDTTLGHSDLIISGSSNLLTVRPFGLAVTDIETSSVPATPNPGGTDFDGDVFTTAGSNFNATVAGVLWEVSDDTDNDGALDTGTYDDNAVTPSYAWDTTLSVLTTGGFTPASGVVGTLNNGDLLETEFAGGSVTVNDLQYTEVGSFTLQSSATGFLGVSGADIVGDDIIVGRFIPDHFVLSSLSLTNRIDLSGCPSIFTYMDENFEVSYDLTAMSAGAVNVTQNYTTASSFARLDTVGELDYRVVDTSVPVEIISRLNVGTTTINFVAGVASSLTSTLDFGRLATGPDGPYSISVGIAPIDDDDVQVIATTLDLDVDGDSLNDHVQIDTTMIYYGRAVVENAFGSELITLDMPMQVEMYDGANFVTNTDDSCTSFTEGNLILSNNLEVGQIDGDILVLTGQTSTATIVNQPQLFLGEAGLSFCPPGSPACTPTSGNAGYIDVLVDLTGLSYPWLQYDWDGDGTFNDDPTATATFGIYSGNDVHIYQIQTFR